MKNYHVYTKGLEDNLIFRCREDYRAGMNYIAVCVLKCDIRILAFVLMSNHFHFVVQGSRAEALKYINIFKRTLSMYISGKYGDRALLQRVSTSCDEISLTDEGLKQCIAYVLDNPVKAGLNCVPHGYEWGSAGCYFSGLDQFKNTIPVRQLGVRKLRTILRTNVVPCDSYRLNSDGYICPKSYVDYGFVENLFGSPRSFQFFLSTSASSRKAKKDVLLFSDQYIMDGIREILQNKYDSVETEMLDTEMKVQLVNDIRRVFNAPVGQIARVLTFPLKFVVNALK